MLGGVDVYGGASGLNILTSVGQLGQMLMTQAALKARADGLWARQAHLPAEAPARP